MVELRTLPTAKAPKGKLDGMWDPTTNSITVYNSTLRVYTTYHLHPEDGTVTIEQTEQRAA